MKELESDKIRKIIINGVTHYSAIDVLREIIKTDIPDQVWKDIKPSIVSYNLETPTAEKTPFIDQEWVKKLIEILKPPPSPFDNLLKGVLNVPKPKQ